MEYEEERRTLQEHLLAAHAWKHPYVWNMGLTEVRTFHSRDHVERDFGHDRSDLTSSRKGEG